MKNPKIKTVSRIVFCLLISLLSANSLLAFSLNSLDRKIKKASKEIGKKISTLDAVLILTFQNSNGTTSNLGKYLSDRIHISLANTSQIKVLDRETLEVLFNERKLYETGLINEESALNFGRTMGAKIVVYGVLNEFEKVIEMNVKITDIEHGQLIGGVRQKFKKTKEVDDLFSQTYETYKEDQTAKKLNSERKPKHKPQSAIQRDGWIDGEPRKKVLFYILDSNAKEVSVKGDFSDWEEIKFDKKSDTLWTKRLLIKHGTYKYVFVVDGKVVRDPNNERISEDGKSIVTVLKWY